MTSREAKMTRARISNQARDSEYARAVYRLVLGIPKPRPIRWFETWRVILIPLAVWVVLTIVYLAMRGWS